VAADSRAQRIAARALLETKRHARKPRRKEATTMADAGAPLVLMAIGLILWLAVDATLAGISIQTIGVILLVVGIVWMLIELMQSRPSLRRRDRVVVRDEPVVRERDVY
jgi:hypothetical protein